jgi:hypothetical protein
LAAVFVARWHQAPAWQMRALDPLICCHRASPFLSFPYFQFLRKGSWLDLFQRVSRSLLVFLSSGLPSSHHPADQCACGDPYRQCGHNGQHRVSPEALRGLIPEFFRGITALLRGTPRYSHAILDGIANRTGGARRLAN